MRNERGATSIEYAFTLILVFLAVVGSWAALGDSVGDLYNDHEKAMQDARKDANTP